MYPLYGDFEEREGKAFRNMADKPSKAVLRVGDEIAVVNGQLRAIVTGMFNGIILARIFDTVAMISLDKEKYVLSNEVVEK